MRLGGMRGGHSSRPSNLGIDSRDMGLFDPGGAAFDPLTLPWNHLYWVSGPKMIALGLANGAAASSYPDEVLSGAVNMTQGTGFRQPTYDATSQDWSGKPALRATDGNRFMIADYGAPIAQPYDIVIIARFGDTNGIIFEQNIGTIGGGPTDVWDVNLGTNTTSAGQGDSSRHFIRLRSDAGGADQLFIDEVAVISSTMGNNDMNRSQIFADRSASFGAAQASVVFVGIMKPVLSSTDIANLFAWAKTFYNFGGGPGPYGVGYPAQLWFKADSITGKNDGDAISQWNDESGLLNHAVQATGSKQPLYKTNIINGKPTVRFDGVDDVLTTPLVPSTNYKDWTIAFVAKDLAATNGRAPFHNGIGATNGYGIATRTTTGKKGLLRGGVAWHDSTVNADLATTVYVAQCKAGTTSLYVNGGAAVLTFATIPRLATQMFRMGDHENTTPAPWNGDILEGLLFDASLSKGDLNTLGAALAARAGTVWTNIP